MLWSDALWHGLAVMSLLRQCPSRGPRAMPRHAEAIALGFALQRIGAQLGSSAYSRGARHGHGHSEMVQCNEGLGFIQPDAGVADVFVHISAVERAGLHDLHEGQKIAYAVVPTGAPANPQPTILKPA